MDKPEGQANPHEMAGGDRVMCSLHSGQKKVSRLTAAICCVLVASCASHMPEVCITPNQSEIECTDFEFRPAYSVMGHVGTKPDVPPSMVARIKRFAPIQTQGARYMMAPRGNLQVLSLSEPAAYDALEKNRSELETLLEQDNLDAPMRRLPELVFQNASQVFIGKLRVQQFPWGKGIVFLTSYIQGHTGCLVNNDMLVLNIQGLSADGRFAVSGHFAIRHPGLPDAMDDKPGGPYVSFDLDTAGENVESWLANQPDNSFQPAIASYIELLAHLQLGTR